MDLDWIINHHGEERQRYFGAVAPPVLQSSIFTFPDVAAMRAAAAREFDAPFYTRGSNPTVHMLRQKLAALEGAEECLVFASGAAAIAAAVIACVAAGDHVVCVQKPYSWTRALLADLLARFGVAHSFVDASDIAEVAAALTPQTRLIVLESPNSLTFEVQDLAAMAALARPRGILTLCDNSHASPLNQSPLALGIDLVAHSATKYLNGHSDVVAGALCGSRALLERVFHGPFMTLGAIPGPHDAALILRGLRTLKLRMQRVAETTPRIAAFLAAHPRVARVWYPHAPDHPQRALVARQMRASSGLVSFALKDTDAAAIARFCDALQRFLLAVSWGGYESLVCPLVAFLPAGAPLLQQPGRAPPQLIRLSIGLEDAEVLIADLEQALDRACDMAAAHAGVAP